LADERYTFEQARVRLEEIAVEVRKKDVSLEKSLDLLEEGVRLANICTELVDHTDLSASAVAGLPDSASGESAAADADTDEAQARDLLDAGEPGPGAVSSAADAGPVDAGPADADHADADRADHGPAASSAD